MTKDNLTTESAITEKIIYEKNMYISKNVEQSISRGYDYDRLYLQRIKSGDIEAVRNHQNNSQQKLPCGQLAKNLLKNAEYKVCAAITLAAHAAIEGGLDPTSAYALNDLYLQKLEACKTVAEMEQLYSEVELIFTQQVNLVRHKRSGASYVEKCKLFIDQNLVMPFTLDDIAAALNVNKSYLSRRFAQEAGMRIMEYTRKKRIEAAASMLKYSDKTIAAIATNFCFPTQSHFGELFKKIMGSTPLKYRIANQVLEVRSNK